MRPQHLRVSVGYNLIATFDSSSNDRSNRRVLPGLNDFTNQVVGGVGLVAVDSKARRVDAKLDPTYKMLRGWLGSFEPSNVMTVALISS